MPVDAPTSKATPAPLLIDSRSACAMLSMSDRKLWQLANCRAIPSRKIGRSRRFCPDELRAWIHAGCPTEPGEGVRVIRPVVL